MFIYIELDFPVKGIYRGMNQEQFFRMVLNLSWSVNQSKGYKANMKEEDVDVRQVFSGRLTR